jgi:hypothetical protein
MGGVQSSRGGQQQQRDAFTNDLRESIVKEVRLNDGYDYDDDDERSPTKPCFFGFCPISNSGSSAASTLVRKFSSAASLLSSSGPPPPPIEDDNSSGFGTPIPDSIEQIRKSRDAALAYEGSLGQYMTSSQYGGLEKELSGMYSSRTTTPSATPPPGPVGGGVPPPPRNGSNPQSGAAANIVDGPVSVYFVYIRFGFPPHPTCLLFCFVFNIILSILISSLSCSFT